MTILAVITAHCRDLATICLASLQRHAPEINRLIVTTDASCQGLAEWFAPSVEVHLKAPPGGAANHAAALEVARRTIPICAPLITPSPDIVLCLDDDVELLSAQFLPRLEQAFHDPGVWMWGAEGIRDPLHPSCLAVRRSAFLYGPPFQAALPDHDTTGVFQAHQRAFGRRFASVPRTVAPEGWETFDGLWAHLGGGVIHSRVPWWRRAGRHVKAIAGHEGSRDLIVKARMRERWVETYG